LVNKLKVIYLEINNKLTISRKDINLFYISSETTC